MPDFDELELKLKLLQLAGGDVDRAKYMLSWLRPEAEGALLADQQDTPPQSNAQASETDAAEEDPTAVAIAAYIEAENADTPTEAERTSVVTDHDRVEQTNTDTVAAVEIPEGFIPWFGGKCPVADGTTVDLLFSDGNVEQYSNPEDHGWGRQPELGEGQFIIAYKVISEPAEASEEAWEPGEQIWTPGGGSYTTERPPTPEPTNPPSEPDSQAQAQPQTKSEQSDNPPEEKFSALRDGGPAGFWAVARGLTKIEELA